MKKTSILESVRICGGRVTKIRREILRILTVSDCLMTQDDILRSLKKTGINPNRSTMFREFNFLTRNNIIIRNTISGVDYFEIPAGHHHHLVCLRCNAINRIEISNHLKKQEKRIAVENRFTVLNHHLEFFGYCRQCRTQ